MKQRLGVIRKANSKVKLNQLAGDADVVISFQNCFNLWKIRLHLTVLIHRNLVIKLVMRSRGLHLLSMKYCAVRQSQMCTDH